MNVLVFDRQVQVISALTEGCSIRATERLTGVHRDTVMRLGARVGNGCTVLHGFTMRDLAVSRIEMDEAWSYVGKKQRQVKQDDSAELGDQYIFLAMDAVSKGILSYRIGKRDGVTTHAFLADLRARVTGAPELSSDAFQAYPAAVDAAFGKNCRFGTIEKHYKYEPAKEAARRYSPGFVVGVTKRDVIGHVQKISTSYIERQNLTLRMQQRRFTRLTNGFSKKLENHKAAVGLYVGHYNWCRVHEALRVTPAMHLGLTDHIWTIGELAENALGLSTEKELEGGLS